MDRLIDIVARLRGPGGCPWDREQTLDSLRPFLIEESYELLESLDADDPDHHREELGDVLLQVLLQARIREEMGAFSFADVAETLAEKLVRRHPHVFGDVTVGNARDVLRNWEVIKSGEKSKPAGSVLDGVPAALPSLQRAQRVQTRASRVGFDWPNPAPVMDKVMEELGEAREAIAGGAPERVDHELGDLLFAVANLARVHGVNAEESLRRATQRFIRRFRAVEERLRGTGQAVLDASLEELDALWNAVKAEEAGQADPRDDCA
jgi:tetrapyrrole methylase family protein/MazG family protein